MALLDPHMLSRRIRDFLLDKAVTDFLSLLFDSRPKLTGSRAWLREASTLERDVAWQAQTAPVRAVAGVAGKVADGARSVISSIPTPW